jgi:hypothetical protein
MALTVPVAAAAADSRFKSHVSFDNFIAGEPTEKNTVAFTLNVKHRGYSYRKRSRTFMVGLDENDYSNYALQWMLGELVDDGDEIVCLRVLDDVKVSSERGVVRKDYQEEARRVMRGIQKMNEEERAISIVLEFAAGKLHQTFQRMVSLLTTFTTYLRPVGWAEMLTAMLCDRSKCTNQPCSSSALAADPSAASKAWSPTVTPSPNGACNTPPSPSSSSAPPTSARRRSSSAPTTLRGRTTCGSCMTRGRRRMRRMRGVLRS